MDSVLEYLKRRANSTFLVAATTFWIIFHWEGICTLFFTDQQLIMDKYGLLKNEYLNQYFFGFRIQDNFWSWLYEIAMFIVPFVLAYLYVWWLPKFVTNPCYKRETEFKVQRRIIKLQADEKVAEQNAKKTKAEVAEVKEQIKLLETQQKAAQKTVQKDPKAAWEKEYKDFQATNANWEITLDRLKELIYTHYGYIRMEYINSDDLLSYDVNGLTQPGSDATHTSLTEKGKYFLKRYSETIRY